MALAKMFKCATTKRSVTYFSAGVWEVQVMRRVPCKSSRLSFVLVPTFCDDNSGASKDKLMAPWKHN